MTAIIKSHLYMKSIEVVYSTQQMRLGKKNGKLNRICG